LELGDDGAGVSIAALEVAGGGDAGVLTALAGSGGGGVELVALKGEFLQCQALVRGDAGGVDAERAGPRRQAPVQRTTGLLAEAPARSCTREPPSFQLSTDALYTTGPASLSRWME
jgi:hypothetical protein